MGNKDKRTIEKNGLRGWWTRPANERGGSRFKETRD